MPLDAQTANVEVLSQTVIKTRADIAVKQLRIEKLFPNFRLSRANADVITGRAKLDTAGNSVAKMLALKLVSKSKGFTQ